MKPATLIIPLALLVFPVRAAAQWVPTGYPPGGSVLCFTAQGDNLFAGTYFGGVFRSTDRGETWSDASTGLSSLLVCSMTANEEFLFAGTGHPSLYFLGGAEGAFRSSNNGETWSAVNAGLPGGSVFALALNGSALFAGTGHGLFLSTDGGDAWREVTIGLTDTIVRELTANATHVFAVAPSGVFASSDNGTSWVLSSNGLPHSGVTTLALNDTYLFAATGDSGLFRSSDNGLTWTPLRAGLPDHLYSPALAVTGTTVVAGGADGRIFHSSDNGEGWSELTTGLPTVSVQAMAVMDSNIYAGTRSQGVLRSTDQGTSWSSAQPGFANTSARNLVADGTCIVATSYWEATGFGEFLGLSRSTDGGVTWMRVGEELGKQITDLAIAGDTLFAGASWGRIYRSTDRGDHWAALDIAYPDTVFKLVTVSDGALFAQATGERDGTVTSLGLHRSTDGGMTWNALNTGLPFWADVSALLKRGSTLLLGINRELYRSSDNGATWNSVDLITGTACVIDAFGTVGSSLLAGVSGLGVFRSTDDGQNWSPANTGFPTTEIVVHGFATIGPSVFVGSGDGVFHSSDEGASWTAVSEGLAGPCISLASFGTNLFAGTWCRGIWKRPLSEMVTSVPVSSAGLPAEFYLRQNFPNPFNPGTTMEYGLPRAGYVTLTVYNVLGEQVSTLIAGDHAAGTFRATWDASRLPSGVYFYRLSAGEYVHTKKAIVMK